MLMPFTIYKEAVKDCAGNWICEGMYVIEAGVPYDSSRKGWVKEVIDENDGKGLVQVRLDASITTGFELSHNWLKSNH